MKQTAAFRDASTSITHRVHTVFCETSSKGAAQAIAEHTQQMVNTVSALMTANKSLVGEIEDVVQEMVRSVNVSCSEAHQPGSGED